MFDHSVVYDGFHNTYSFKKDGRMIKLYPMNPVEIRAFHTEMNGGKRSLLMRRHGELRGPIDSCCESSNFCRYYQSHIPWNFEESINQYSMTNLFELGDYDRDQALVYAYNQVQGEFMVIWIEYKAYSKQGGDFQGVHGNVLSHG